jgi:peptide/nickel transport system permease protein
LNIKLYLLRRFYSAAIVLIGVSILIFIIARMIPGDPARMALGPTATQEMVEKYRDKLHLNDPIHIQYWFFIKGITKGDLGESVYTKRKVTTDVSTYFPATLELIIFASLIMIFVGVPLGILAGRFKDKAIDNISRFISLLGVVTPSFVWAVFLMIIFAFYLDILPVAGRLSQDTVAPERITGLIILDSIIRGQFNVTIDALKHIILPALALSLGALGQASRLTRSNITEVYDKQYIEMARAYGYNEFKIATKYALKPAMIPTLTILGLDFAAMLGNAFLVEFVFAWPGIAKYGVQAILYKDLNAITATTMIIATFFVFTNLIVDLIVAYLNPKIRLSGK